MSFFGKFINKTEGSVFAKLSHADYKLEAIKGRIAASDLSTASHHEFADTYEKEAARVHRESDEVHSRLDGILSTL